MDPVSEAYQEILEEGRLSNALIAGAIAISGIGAFNHFNRVHSHHEEVKTSIPEKQDDSLESLKSAVLTKYKHLDPKLAHHVVSLAKKHEHPVFPKAKDILSVVGIESSFDPKAKSKLKKDPAIGLTQIRPKVWGIDKKMLSTPEEQIKKSVEILSSYHEKLGSPEDALHAYNIGITNFKRQKGLNPSYVDKFKREKMIYEDL